MNKSGMMRQIKTFKTRNTLPSQNQLLDYANKFIVDDRLSSLERDVNECLKTKCAFPAFLYCFSVIDMLGMLYMGGSIKTRRRRKVMNPTTQYARKYMKRFMAYDSEQITLLQTMFRHKIVHLAQPKPAVKDKGRIIAWRYYERAKKTHLDIVKLKKIKKIRIRTPYNIYCNYLLKISIPQLRDDIIDSVKNKSNGFLAALSADRKLQQRFRKAINEIYSPVERK